MTPEQVAELRQKRYNATVARIDKSHTDLARFRVKPDFPLQPHSPGQYTTLGLGSMLSESLAFAKISTSET